MIASEARKIAEEYPNKYSQNKLRDLLLWIETEASEGHFSCQWSEDNKEVLHFIISNLKNLGYKVDKPYEDIGTYIFSISWKGDDLVNVDAIDS